MNAPDPTDVVTELLGAGDVDLYRVVLQTMPVLQALADKLRETADELWDGKINQFHAANRLRKFADQIAKKEK